MTLEQGDFLYNRYRILDILGRGGMGSVYHAIDESLGVEVAVKENLFVTEEYEQQFRLEAVILASLRHPNLPRVTDHFTIDGQGQYLVMDYIEGRDLRHIMETGPLSEEETIRIGVAVCDALTYLHTRKRPVLHRDIKPGNVRIAPDGQVYLVDFGLAKMASVDEHTLSGARAMTPGYSPPEQYGTSRTDSRTDIYSLGATLYAALTGFIPEDGLARVVDEIALTPLRKRNPKVSKELADVIEKAMEPHANNRYQSAEDFRRALLSMEAAQPDPHPAGTMSTSQVPQAEGSKQPPDGPPPAVEKNPTEHPIPGKSSPFAWIMLVGVLALFALAATWIVNNPSSAPAPLRDLLSLIINPTSTFTTTATLTRPLTNTATVRANATPRHTATFAPASATPTKPLEETPSPSPISKETTIPTPTIIGGGIGEIAFASLKNNISQIYLIGANNTNLRRLTNELNGACQPAWSPDGKKLVYVSPCPDKSDQYPKSSLYVLDLDSGGTTGLLTVHGGDFEPAWSPDGTKIAFCSVRDGSPEIYVLNLVDQVVKRLTIAPNSTVQSRQPAWSPDGSRIVYAVRRSGIFRIWTMSADGTNQAQLFSTGSGFSNYLPVWSPDNSFILFSQANVSISSPSSLKRFTLNSDQPIQIGPISEQVVDVNFSPDGHWIAYETSDTKNQDIFIYNLSDSSRQRLTTDSSIDFDPAWRP
jgi:serine/threonine protein kinase